MFLDYDLKALGVVGFFRLLFYTIDNIVYKFISIVYDLLMSVAKTSVLSQADILQMADRIYKLLAIFMIFKVIFSLITYVVNPDDFSDKSKGISKLGMNIVVSLVLLILTPYFFNYAYQLQTIILEDNAIGTLIFGKKANSDFLSNAGDKMAYTGISAFFKPNTAIDELSECVDLYDGNGNINEACFGVATPTDGNYEIQDKTGMAGLISDSSGNVIGLTETSLLNYAAGVDKGVYGLMFREEMVVAEKSNNQFIMEYNFIFSTAVGVIIILLLISFCLDVALRSVKLAFLQLIAPIPILSYIDPKSGKDGMFKKWYQMCLKTFLSLFIRLLALYFALYLIEIIMGGKMVNIVDGSYQTNQIVKILIMIGALMFAKQFPKILEGLGIKLDGDGKFNLNPLRKIEKEALGGGLLKKPNDMLAKGAKAIAMSPVTALSTTGKRSVAALYSAANGRGLRRGWKSVDSPFKRSLNKKIDEWAPDFAKDRQESRVAKLDLQESEKKEKRMKKYFDGDKKAGKKAFLNKLGSVDSKYLSLYLDAENKKGEMYQAQSSASRWISAINNGQLTAEQRKVLSSSFNSKDKLLTDNELIQNLEKVSGTAKKVYEKAEEAKANYGKTSASARRAAELDKAYDSYDKLNSPIGSNILPDYVLDESYETSELSESSSENQSAEDNSETINFSEYKQNIVNRSTDERVRLDLSEAVEIFQSEMKMAKSPEVKKQLEKLAEELYNTIIKYYETENPELKGKIDALKFRLSDLVDK